jgi:acyl transferase domain-containing protein
MASPMLQWLAASTSCLTLQPQRAFASCRQASWIECVPFDIPAGKYKLILPLSALQALSPVGRCKSFDASADGYGRGEGFVAAVLQRSRAALAPGSTNDEGGSSAAAAGQPFCLVLGSAVNQAGRSGGLTAPNGPSQTALVCTALAVGEVDPGELRFLSVHGTGTALGDPIEVGALAQALPVAAQLTLLSNKSCYGHTEGAAGLTGLLLAAEAVSQAAATPIMHLRNVNPYVSAALGDWSAGGGTTAQLSRQTGPGGSMHACGSAGTSSFGMSGVNAHMLVAPPSLGSEPSVSTAVSMNEVCARKQQRAISMPHTQLSNSSYAMCCRNFLWRCPVSGAASALIHCFCTCTVPQGLRSHCSVTS